MGYGTLRRSCTSTIRLELMPAAGYLEMGETGEEGAGREAQEELHANVLVGPLLAVYSLPHIGQM